MIDENEVASQKHDSIENKLNDKNIEDDPAVASWIHRMRSGGHPEQEISEKLETLVEFCDYAGCSPNELVSRCIRDGKIVIKERKKIEDLIEEFAPDSVDKANTVRSFMIHNGVRMIPPKPPWL